MQCTVLVDVGAIWCGLPLCFADMLCTKAPPAVLLQSPLRVSAGAATVGCCRPRAVKLVAVISALLTPQVIDDVMALVKACFTDERINRCDIVLFLEQDSGWQAAIHWCPWCAALDLCGAAFAAACSCSTC